MVPAVAQEQHLERRGGGCCSAWRLVGLRDAMAGASPRNSARVRFVPWERISGCAGSRWDQSRLRHQAACANSRFRSRVDGSFQRPDAATCTHCGIVGWVVQTVTLTSRIVSVLR